MATGLIGLAEAMAEHSGEDGPELEALVFYVAAGFADCVGRKDVGDYFISRCNESFAKTRWAKDT